MPSHYRALPGKGGNTPRLANTWIHLKTTARHQLALTAITVVQCLVITLPLELQRRIVKDALQRRDFRPIGVLALAYFLVAIVQRGIKARDECLSRLVIVPERISAGGFLNAQRPCGCDELGNMTGSHLAAPFDHRAIPDGYRPRHPLR